MADSLLVQVGNTVLPSKASDVAADQSLAPLDPARDVLLACLAAAIVFELGPAWDVVTSGIDSLAGVSPVADTWPGSPTPDVVLQRKTAFPCLFLARDGLATYDDFTLARRRRTQIWGLHYIMSPVTIGDRRRIDDALKFIGDVAQATIERGGHEAYSGGSRALAEIGFSTLRLVSTQSGQARFAEGETAAPIYNALSCILESTEIMRPVPGTAAPFNGASFALGTGDGSGVIAGLVNSDTEVPGGTPLPR